LSRCRRRARECDDDDDSTTTTRRERERKRERSIARFSVHRPSSFCTRREREHIRTTRHPSSSDPRDPRALTEKVSTKEADDRTRERKGEKP